MNENHRILRTKHILLTTACTITRSLSGKRSLLYAFQIVLYITSFYLDYILGNLRQS
jgi:hypothetical protein